MTTRSLLAALLILSALCSGCGASIPGLTTGSLFGGAPAKTEAAQIPNDPLSRTIQVGTTAARATKCGFNFDQAKLRTQFLAAETAANPADAAKLSQIYDVSFNGVSRAVAGKGEDYCSASKTGKIKEALNRHLAGDYTPAPPEPVVEEEDSGGLFGNPGASGDAIFKDGNP